MAVIKIDSINEFRTKTGVLAKQLLKHDNVTVMYISLDPQDAIPEHSVAVDVFFYVISGKGTIKIGEDEGIVEKTDIITCPPNTMMSLKADQGEKFIVLNVKTPSV